MSKNSNTAWSALARMWSSQYSKYYLLAAFVAVVIANLLDVRIVGFGKLDAEATSAIGTWFSGMLTVITIAIAAQTFRHDRQRTDAASIKDAAAELERQRMAAGAVFSWLKLDWDHVIDAPRSFTLHFSNQTSAPVYEWSLEVEGGAELTCSNTTHGPILPGGSDFRMSDDGWVRLAKRGKVVRVGLRFLSTTNEMMLRRFDGGLQVVEGAGMQNG